MKCELDVLEIVGIENGVDMLWLDIRLGLKMRTDDGWGDVEVVDEDTSVTEEMVTIRLSIRGPWAEQTMSGRKERGPHVCD